MELQRATEYLRQLADGFDPITKTRLPDESVYNAPEIIRALHRILNELDSRSRLTPSVNAGRAWSADEEAELLTQFNAGMDVSEIAVLHGRTVGAIETRLSELGKKDQIRFAIR